MGNRVGLEWLLLIFLGIRTTNAQDPFTGLRDNSVPDGEATRRADVATLDGCRTSCATNDQCKAFAFDKSEQTCYLYTRVRPGGYPELGVYSSGLAIIEKAGYVSAFKRSSFPPPPFPFQQYLSDAGAPGIPLFSDFPVSRMYVGPIATPKFKSAAEKEYIEPLVGHTSLEPNFAGQFRIVQFRIGSGPIGAVMVDSKTGSVFHLPHEVAKDDFLVRDTECLALLRGLPWAKAGDKEDAAAPLSFKTESELLGVKQCRPSAVDRIYYRWHGRRWHFVTRFASPPPPVS